MRDPFGSLLRWWRPDNGHARGDASPGSPEDPAGDVRPLRRETPLEPPWLAQLEREGIPRTLHYPTTTLGRLLDHAAERFGDVPAILYNQKRWTYRELLARVNRLAGGLARHGVRTGDRVVLALPNCPEYVISFFALQKLGALPVNAGPLMGADDLRQLIAHTTPRAVMGLDLEAPKLIGAATDSFSGRFIWVTLQSYQTVVRRLGYQLKLWQGRTGIRSRAEHTTITLLYDNAPAKPPTVEPSPDAVAVLQPTSGTTGSLKLAELTHRGLLANATQVGAWMGAREGQERVLTVLPMFHVYGLTMGLIHPVLAAASITLLTRFDVAQTLEVLEGQRPTVFPLVPAICEALSGEIARRGRPLAMPALRCISGAAPLSPDMAHRFEALTGARVVEGYGLSEASPVTHANLLSRPRYGSVGLPMPDTLCRIVDLEEGQRDVALGEAGELLVAGPQLMRGYYRNAEETQRVLRADEQGRTWLCTGDVVRMDEDGFFQIVDRKKDMIIRSGLKVYPGKVEHVLRTHPHVADAAVIGRADPLHTEAVVAIVVPASTSAEEDALADELRAVCRSHLAPYEVPTAFEFTDRIPRSVLGKVLKKELRRPPDPLGVPTESERERRAA